MSEKRIKDLPESMRPYERCDKYGAEYLSDCELLSIIIRSGTKGEIATEVADKVLSSNPAYLGLLGMTKATRKEFEKIKGIGRIKAMQIECVVELSKRISKAVNSRKLCFSRPDTIAEYYMEDLRHKEYEEVMVLFLNTKSLLLGEYTLSKGTINSSIASPRDIYYEALKINAVFIILIHNHPSGDPSPSNDDIVNTRRIKEAGELIGIKLLDHIIIGDNKYVSMKQMNIC